MLSETPTDGVRCGVYAVGYFDLCGQSNELLPYCDVNSVSLKAGRIQSDFGRIATVLRNFRRDIVAFFDGVAQMTLADHAPIQVPPEAVAIAKELDSTKIQLQGFSDTVVVYLPLATSQGNVSLYKLTAMLVSVSSTMLTTFARGSIVRGAIDVTWAMEPFEGEIYGPALLSTYKLESKAKWPRVVLGPNIQSIWQTFSEQRSNSQLSMMNRIFAKHQAALSFRDTDDQIAVDYLGAFMQTFMVDSLEPGLIDAAHVGLESELLQRAGNGEIEDKLRRTLGYFESRIGPLTEERRQNASKLVRLRPPSQ